MDQNIFDKIHEVDLKKTMEDNYIDYAMSVITSRAVPDVRDGLKPVQRRILHAMIELNNGPDKPHRKCARIVVQLDHRIQDSSLHRLQTIPHIGERPGRDYTHSIIDIGLFHGLLQIHFLYLVKYSVVHSLLLKSLIRPGS